MTGLRQPDPPIDREPSRFPERTHSRSRNEPILGAGTDPFSESERTRSLRWQGFRLRNPGSGPDRPTLFFALPAGASRPSGPLSPCGRGSGRGVPRRSSDRPLRLSSRPVVVPRPPLPDPLPRGERESERPPGRQSPLTKKSVGRSARKGRGNQKRLPLPCGRGPGRGVLREDRRSLNNPEIARSHRRIDRPGRLRLPCSVALRPMTRAGGRPSGPASAAPEGPGVSRGRRDGGAELGRSRGGPGAGASRGALIGQAPRAEPAKTRRPRRAAGSGSRPIAASGRGRGRAAVARLAGELERLGVEARIAWTLDGPQGAGRRLGRAGLGPGPVPVPGGRRRRRDRRGPDQRAAERADRRRPGRDREPLRPPLRLRPQRPARRPSGSSRAGRPRSTSAWPATAGSP